MYATASSPTSGGSASARHAPARTRVVRGVNRIDKSEAEWREELAPDRYAVLRQSATEPPFSGALYRNHAEGSYQCAACGDTLFSSATKFDSGSGWPSFWGPEDRANVELVEDRSHGMVRVEARCAACDSHLGHVFTGEGYGTPTDERWCINSVSLTLEPKE